MPRVRIGSAEVDLTLRTAQYSAAVEKVKRQTKSMATSMKAAATKTRSLTSALIGIGAASVAAKAIFDIGSAAEETASKFSTVFGPATDDVQKFVDNFGVMAGLSNTAAREVLATTGAIVQGMGFAQEASGAFATEIVRLAGDLSSFNNIPIEETSLAVQSALTGEREQLKRLGIVINEADVQQRALVISGKAAVKTLTQQEKATATLQLITERAGVAIGDLARTQDSAANQARQVGAEIQNLKEDLATALLPAISVAVEGFGKFIKGLQIMGAEAAVLHQRFKVVEAALTIWDRDALPNAIQKLNFLKQAAEEVKLEIVGLSFEVGAFSDSAKNMATVLGSGSGGGGLVVPAIGAVNSNLLNLSVTLPETATTLDSAASSALVLASGLNAAADASDRLNAASSKLGNLSRLLGFIPGLGGLAGLFGQGSGIFGAVSGLLKDTGGFISSGSVGIVGERGPELVRGPAQVTSRSQTASMMGGGELTVNIRLHGLADGTVRTIRRKLHRMEALDVPVVI